VERISTACPAFSCTIRKLFIAAIFVAAVFVAAIVADELAGAEAGLFAGFEGTWEYAFTAQQRRIADQIRGEKFWRSSEQQAEKPHGRSGGRSLTEALRY
jgi:hypothetical protein